MGEMFTLQGTGPEGRKKGRWGTILLVGIVAVLALFVAVRIFQNPVSRPLVGEFGQAFHSAEARKQALETILPGAKLPQPFVIRGAARAGDAEAVWMRRDFDDAHAILISGPEALTPDQVRTLLEELGHERLPSRQIIDEKGVQIDKRPPFVEEYRMPPGPARKILPPKDWVTSWSDAVRRTRSAASGVPVSLDLGDGNLYPMEGYRSDPPYWWTLVDLGSKGRPGMHLFLFHALKEKQAPNTSELVRFSRELMRTSKESALPPPGRPPR